MFRVLITRVILTTLLNHKGVRGSIDVQVWHWEQLCRTVSSLFLLSLECISMVAVPMGYKIVISRALEMYWIYCTRPLGCFTSSGFGAINPIHPLCPWYNYFIYIYMWLDLRKPSVRPVHNMTQNNVLRWAAFTSTFVEMQYDARIDSGPIRALPCVYAFRKLTQHKALCHFVNWPVRDPCVIRAKRIFSSSGPNLSKSRFCHIHVNPSSNCSSRLRRLVVSYKGEISLHNFRPT